MFIMNFHFFPPPLKTGDCIYNVILDYYNDNKYLNLIDKSVYLSK